MTKKVVNLFEEKKCTPRVNPGYALWFSPWGEFRYRRCWRGNSAQCYDVGYDRALLLLCVLTCRYVDTGAVHRVWQRCWSDMTYVWASFVSSGGWINLRDFVTLTCAALTLMHYSSFDLITPLCCWPTHSTCLLCRSCTDSVVVAASLSISAVAYFYAFARTLRRRYIVLRSSICPYVNTYYGWLSGRIWTKLGR